MARVTPIRQQNRQKIFDGSSKTVFQILEDEGTLVLFFKDEFKFNGEITNISGKGIINNSISTFMMEKLDLVGIDNHLIEKSNMREQVVQILDIIPVQVKVSNVAVDNYVSCYGVQEGYLFNDPMIEFKVKNPVTGNPTINETQMVGFNWMLPYEVKQLKKAARRVNDFLAGFFAGCGLRLVECNLEFGRVFNGEDFILMLADEITPESCRLWDLHSNQKFDLETIASSDKPLDLYKEIAKRIGAK